MPPASTLSRRHKPPATKSPLSQQLGTQPEPPLSRQAKRKVGNAVGREDGAAKAETKEFPDDIMFLSPPTEPDDIPSQSQPAEQQQPNHVVSPVLDALNSLGGHDGHDTAHRTDSWAKSIPFGKSPPNDLIDGLSISESPPHLAAPGDKGGFSHSTSPASPPLGKYRPLRHGSGNGNGNGHANYAPSRYPSGDKHQRCSSSSHPMNQIPLPHLPQPHFYAAPDIEIPHFPSPNMRALGESGYTFCAFDSIANPHSTKTNKVGSNVVLVGRDGCLEILGMEGDKIKVVGKLDGLTGRVLDAKILTCASKIDPFASCRPLVAISIHGPALAPEDGGVSSSTSSDHVEIVPAVSTTQSKRGEHPHVQTRVQIYSLKTQEHITTLYSTKPVPYLDYFPGLPASASSPVGNLKIHASGNFLVIASGTSGEVFIYSVAPNSSPGAFQCLGKTWTSMKWKDTRRYSSSSNSTTDVDDYQSDASGPSANPETPIVSLSGRWLAVVAPSASHRVSLHGTIPSHLIQKKTYGLDSHTPPSRPSVTCSVDSGEGESLLNKVARGVTQELFKGARWIGDQSVQTWNSYWNKDGHSTQATSSRRPYPYDTQMGHNILPPTHAPDTQAGLAGEPDLVSIIDLKKLEESQDVRSSFPLPIATFQPPNGCSFLSFAPSGLMLLTSSKKGDIQHIWDLMQVKHCRSRAFISDDLTSSGVTSNPPALHVRQVVRYARLTTSRIVDVIWTAPTGEHLAIITKKGTVHVYDLPRSAFQWPPPRRVVPSKTNHKDPSTGDDHEEAAPSNPFSAAMKLVGGTTQPILAAVRGRAPSVGAAFSGGAGGLGLTAATGVRGGGKVVAAGLSKSMGAATGTVNTLRHVGENRLHLSGFSRDAVPARVTWLDNCSEDEPILAVIESGTFKAYRIRRSLADGKNKQSHSVIGSKVSEIRLPANVQVHSGPEQAQAQAQAQTLALPSIPIPVPVPTPVSVPAEPHVSGFWTLPSQTLMRRGSGKLKSQPLSQAEIEANAPYQPFHTDRRVNLFVYPPGHEEHASIQQSEPQAEPWVFGNTIPGIKLNLRASMHDGGDDEGGGRDGSAGGADGGGEIESMISLGNEGGDVEHVVITARRKRRGGMGSSGTAGGDDAGGGRAEEGGFFEDDCDVLDFARDRV
ncbi:uncharacterized protein PADG_07760 [Paracoccidioides brasiliensis Pb18]|uniref:BCAS3 domain-containing protein n=1 Tax=Paracoccidioides brasiliensis (strain Pb18) TaxID=502780 RepID=C1GKH4_PARBD|nr:uncharacterized protein PADG_07760 [Paracoccidioides brasiliensis Pb18]EEH42940.2 hypothetical protein PADG_07760 [Paracoccidioides brasiliensis Pb18]